MAMRLPRIIRPITLLKPLVLIALIFSLYNRFRPSPSSAAAFDPLPYPDYARNKQFRSHASATYEAAVTSALVEIEDSLRAKDVTAAQQYPVRRIWQTVSAEKDLTADARDWERKNTGWEYTVRHPTLPPMAESQH